MHDAPDAGVGPHEERVPALEEAMDDEEEAETESRRPRVAVRVRIVLREPLRARRATAETAAERRAYFRFTRNERSVGSWPRCRPCGKISFPPFAVNSIILVFVLVYSDEHIFYILSCIVGYDRNHLDLKNEIALSGQGDICRAWALGWDEFRGVGWELLLYVLLL